jgi:predicted nuclease with TOPRIM domain
MKYYLLMIATMLMMSACNQKKLAETEHEKDSLIAVLNQRDSSLNEFIGSFNDVERNLADVTEKQHVINVTTGKETELKSNQKERIKEQIAAINNLMDDNRKKIDELNRKIKSSSGKNAQLQKMVTTLNDQLAQKNKELADLNDKLNALNAQVGQLQTSVNSLTEENTSKTQTIAEQTTALHTAYYVVGKTKQLQDAKIIDRSGGLLGIGKTAKLSGNIDNSKFTRIDYTQTTSIPVNSEMKIVTSHPSDSYTLEKDTKDKDKVTSITITNPEKFWSESKYLVVLTH